MIKKKCRQTSCSLVPDDHKKGHTTIKHATQIFWLSGAHTSYVNSVLQSAEHAIKSITP